jgi:hypothetical protein
MRTLPSRSFSITVSLRVTRWGRDPPFILATSISLSPSGEEVWLNATGQGSLAPASTFLCLQARNSDCQGLSCPPPSRRGYQDCSRFKNISRVCLHARSKSRLTRDWSSTKSVPRILSARHRLNVAIISMAVKMRRRLGTCVSQRLCSL